jgi:hypothetical protein
MTERLKQFVRPAAVLVGLAALFTWFGVYDVSSHPVLRFVMWLVTMSVGGLSAIWIIPAVFEWRFAQQNFIVRVALAAALIALPVTASSCLAPACRLARCPCSTCMSMRCAR